MLKFIVVVAFIGLASAATLEMKKKPEEKEIVSIVKSETEQEENGSYNFMFESGDGSFRQEKGVIVMDKEDEAHMTVTGMYKYVDADGKEIVVSYTADENGFVPIGSNIPESISNAAKAAVAVAEAEPKQPKEIKKKSS